MSQSVLTNTTIASIGRVINAIGGVVVIGLLARLQGPAWIGVYTLLLAYGAILQMMADAGLYLTLTRQIGEPQAEEKKILSRIVSLRFCLFVIVFISGGLATFFIPSLRDQGLTYSFVALGLLFQSLSQLFMGVYQKHGLIWRATMGDLVGRLVQILALLLLLPHGISLTTAMAIFATSAAVSWLFHWQWLPHKPVVRFRKEWPIWRHILRVSWPLGLVLLLNTIYFRIDTLILSLFRSPEEVGWYGVAYRVMESGLFFPAMFGGLLLPRLAHSLADNRAEAKQWLEEGLHFVLLAVGFVVAVMITQAEPIIRLIAGTQFIPAAPLLAILSLALSFMCLGTVFGFTLVALGRQRAMVILSSLLIIGNIILNLSLIPIYGAKAAAWVTVATEAVATISAAWLVWQKIPYRFPLGLLVRLAGATIITVSFIQLFPLNWPGGVRIVLASGVYIIAVVVTGLYTARHFRLLTNPLQS